MLTEEKKKWLESIGAKEFPEPIKYIYTFPGYDGAHNLSEKYVEDTPIEVLRAQYIINAEMAKSVIENKKNRIIFAKPLNFPKKTKLVKRRRTNKSWWIWDKR